MTWGTRWVCKRRTHAAVALSSVFCMSMLEAHKSSKGRQGCLVPFGGTRHKGTGGWTTFSPSESRWRGRVAFACEVHNQDKDVNRPLVFAVATVSSIPSSHRRVSTQALTWINTSHQAFTIQDFFITNHVLITEVLILDELNHNFSKSVSLLDAESFVSYDTLDQDLPDVSWIGISGLKTKQGRLQGRQVLILLSVVKELETACVHLTNLDGWDYDFYQSLNTILTPPQHNKNPGLVLSSFKHEFLETDCSVIVKLKLNRRNGMCGILGCSCFLWARLLHKCAVLQLAHLIVACNRHTLTHTRHCNHERVTHLSQKSKLWSEE